jgi:hypothetical protein
VIKSPKLRIFTGCFIVIFSGLLNLTTILASCMLRSKTSQWFQNSAALGQPCIQIRSVTNFQFSLILKLARDLISRTKCDIFSDSGSFNFTHIATVQNYTRKRVTNIFLHHSKTWFESTLYTVTGNQIRQIQH